MTLGGDIRAATAALRLRADDLDDIADQADALPPGEGGPSEPPLVETVVEVAPNTGTATGNITGDGGLARIHSGTKTGNTNGGNASYKSSTTSGNYGVIYAEPKRFDRFVIYGCSDVGLWHSGNPQSTISVYAKLGAQSSPTDGMLLGSVTAADANGMVVPIQSGDKITEFDRFSVVITQPGSVSNLWVAGVAVHEIVLGAAAVATRAIMSPVLNRVFQQVGGVASFDVTWRGVADQVSIRRVSDGAVVATNATGAFSGIAAGWYEAVLLSGGVEVDSVPFGVGDVYLVAGQSNAASAVQPSSWTPAVPDSPGKVILSDLYANGLITGFHLFRDVAKRPLTYSPSSAGGAWLYCGLALNLARNYPIMFVIVAKGNTNTAEWVGGLCQRIYTAWAMYAPKAILWLQGESDAAGGFSQAASFNNMNTMVTALKAISDLPWVIGLNSSYPNYAPIRAAQQQLDAAWAHVHIGPDCDPLRNGQVEFMGDDMRRVGEAFAQRLITLGL